MTAKKSPAARMTRARTFLKNQEMARGYWAKLKELQKSMTDSLRKIKDDEDRADAAMMLIGPVYLYEKKQIQDIVNLFELDLRDDWHEDHYDASETEIELGESLSKLKDRLQNARWARQRKEDFKRRTKK